MKKILIIDSHKGAKDSIPQNMHWQNADIIADILGADLIWSYPTVNDNIKSGYDAIIFVHASHYAFTDYKWVEQSPDAKLFYITNEYNLGEPRTLWMAAKQGRKYTVIGNHDSSASKVVMKYVDEWININLNALIFNPINTQFEPFRNVRSGCIYYGSFRKDRSKYFEKYLTKNVLLSTHSKNIDKFRNAGATSDITGRIDWRKDGLFKYKHSLYIEDEKTHTNYNYLGNRFYEALNYGCLPLFSEECRNTVSLSDYKNFITDEYFIDSSDQIKDKVDLEIPDLWKVIASNEKRNVIRNIKQILNF